jgi:hypothetical protein
VLDQDVKIGNAVVVPKGPPVTAAITQADPAAHAGAPGDIAFQVHFLTVHGTQIPLRGGETLEGENRYGSHALLFVPVVGLASLAIRSDEAEINPGMVLTADVAADTPLQP